ncbi:hypothetical protein D3C84_939930 [compost metagenome]
MALPQVSRRPSSSPAKLVAQTLLAISSWGLATARTCSSTPASRNTSMVRWLVMCARGLLAVQRYLLIKRFRIP